MNALRHSMALSISVAMVFLCLVWGTTALAEHPNVSLPEGYPYELVPIMDDAISGGGMRTDTHYSVVYTTPASVEQVLAFYLEHFTESGGDVSIADNSLEIHFEIEGRKVDIYLDPTGGKTTLNIGVFDTTASTYGHEVSEPNQDADDLSPAVASLGDVIPLVSGAYIMDEYGEETSEGFEYSATVLISQPFTYVAAFYADLLKEMPSSSVSMEGGEFWGRATFDASSIEIQIVENGPEESIMVVNIYAR